jgi:hypothetical protein
MSQSDHVLRAVLDLAGRSDLMIATDFSDLKKLMSRLLERLEDT